MKAYRFFAYLIAVEVVIQAAAIAFAVFGEGHWVMEDGGVVNKALIDAKETDTFTGAIGFAIHPINGTMIIPLIAIIFLIVSFFAKVPGGVRNAAIIFGLIALQIVLGIAGHDVVWLGPLHAINAFGIFYMAIRAARQAALDGPHDDGPASSAAAAA